MVHKESSFLLPLVTPGFGHLSRERESFPPIMPDLVGLVDVVLWRTSSVGGLMMMFLMSKC